MKKLFLQIIFASIFIVLNSCIEDNITPPLTGDLNPVGEMLIYFETQGDFVNTLSTPALVTAEEVNSNLSSYLIVDIRDNDDFINGHIEGAVNILIDSLYDFVKSIDSASYPKIILISKNGQSSAYFTCLLRLSGLTNIYSLKYGMASWNQVFAGEWINALADHPNIFLFTNDIFSKDSLTGFPEITFDNPGATISQRVEGRIVKIINEGFQYSQTLPAAFGNYIVCYGSGRLYFARNDYPLAGFGHQAGTVSYFDSPFFEFRSVKDLQTLPADQPIYIYDYDGQLSACMTAYFRVLGYNAKSIIFGGNQIFYSRMIGDPELVDYAFTAEDIQNYSYVTGN